MIEVFATTENGEGYTMLVGTFECIDEIKIFTGMWGDKVKLTFSETSEDEK